MSYKSKVTYASIGAVMLLSMVAFFINGASGDQVYASLGYSILMMAGIILEVAVLLIIGLVLYFTGPDKSPNSERKQKGNAFFLAIGLVLLVGVSLCFGGTLYYDGI